MILGFALAVTIPFTGSTFLAPGTVEVTTEIRIPDGAHDLKIFGSKTTLRAARNFRGRAVLVCRGCRNTGTGINGKPCWCQLSPAWREEVIRLEAELCTLRLESRELTAIRGRLAACVRMVQAASPFIGDEWADTLAHELERIVEGTYS